MERAGFDMSGGLEMSLGDDMGDIDLDASEMTSAARVTPNDDALLSSLFMGREAQEAQAVLGGGGNYAASGYDIEFDADSMLEGRTSPNEVARFQVGRQSPPRMPFSAARLEGPSDGTIVSRREGGSWQRTAAAETPRLTIQAHAGQPQSGTNNNNGGNLDFTRSLREAYAVPPPRPAPAPRPTVSRQNIPSVYQRIMRGGAFDDD